MTNTMKKVRSEFNWDGTENHLGISSASVFLLGLASNGPKRPKSPFLGLVRVGPTHGLIALVPFALELDKCYPKTDEIQQFSCTITLPFLNLSTLSILKIINKSVIVHFHPDFDPYPNWLF